MADFNYYTPASQYVGKSLAQIRDTGLTFRPDTLGSFLGIGENQPLTADSTYQLSNLPANYQNSGESQAFRQIFSAPGMSPEQKAIQPAVQSLESSVPEISQKFQTERTRIEGEKQPLTNRYNALLTELKRREGVDIGQTQTATAREYGKRGIPLSSGTYDQALIEKTRPISEFYTGQTTTAALSREDSLRQLNDLLAGLAPQEVEAIRGIKSAIASLQAGAGTSAIANAQQAATLAEQQRQFNESNALAQANLAFQKTQQDLSKGYISLPEGSTLLSLLTGQPLYTAPKTNKPTGSGTGSGTGYNPAGV